MDLDLALKMLGYSRLLKRIATGDSFDYSVAQVTSEWIAEAIQGCSPHFTSLADSISGLKDAVALSFGLGITEIWSTLLIQTPPCSVTTALSSLDSAACQNLHPPDNHGMYIRESCLSL